MDVSVERMTNPLLPLMHDTTAHDTTLSFFDVAITAIPTVHHVINSSSSTTTTSSSKSVTDNGRSTSTDLFLSLSKSDSALKELAESTFDATSTSTAIGLLAQAPPPPPLYQNPYYATSFYHLHDPGAADPGSGSSTTSSSSTTATTVSTGLAPSAFASSSATLGLPMWIGQDEMLATFRQPKPARQGRHRRNDDDDDYADDCMSSNRHVSDDDDDDDYIDEDDYDDSHRQGRKRSGGGGRRRSLGSRRSSSSSSSAGKKPQRLSSLSSSNSSGSGHLSSLRAALNTGNYPLSIKVPTMVEHGYSGRQDQVAFVQSMTTTMAPTTAMPFDSRRQIERSSREILENEENEKHNDMQLQRREYILDTIQQRDRDLANAAKRDRVASDLVWLDMMLEMARAQICHVATKVAQHARVSDPKKLSSFSSRNKGCLRAATRALLIVERFRATAATQQDDAAATRITRIPAKLVRSILDLCLPPTSARPPSDVNTFVAVYSECMEIDHTIRTPQVIDIDHAWFRLIAGTELCHAFLRKILDMPGKWIKSIPADFVLPPE